MRLVSETWNKLPKPDSKRKQRYGMYECPECLKIYERRVSNVDSKRCIDCAHTRLIKHDESHSKMYNKWASMKNRCTNPNNQAYHNYGARGITVCPEWRDSYQVFSEWCLANGYVDGGGFTLDRKDNDAGYSPDNCRFVSKSVQLQNTRLLSPRNKSGYRGVYWCNTKNKFRASIGHKRKTIGLGASHDPKECARMFDAYIKEHGLEQPLNFPDE